jgi:hypothetical protein
VNPQADTPNRPRPVQSGYGHVASVRRGALGHVSHRFPTGGGGAASVPVLLGQIVNVSTAGWLRRLQHDFALPQFFGSLDTG